MPMPPPGRPARHACRARRAAGVRVWGYCSRIASIIKARSISTVRREYRKDPSARMGWFVIVGTLPVGTGAAFQDTIETSLRDLRITAAALIVFGMIRAVADRSRAVR